MVVKILSVVKATIQSHKTGGWIDEACVWKNLTHEHDINQIVQIAFLFYFFSPVFCVWASFCFVLKKKKISSWDTCFSDFCQCLFNCLKLCFCFPCNKALSCHKLGAILLLEKKGRLFACFQLPQCFNSVKWKVCSGLPSHACHSGAWLAIL